MVVAACVAIAPSASAASVQAAPDRCDPGGGTDYPPSGVPEDCPPPEEPPPATPPPGGEAQACVDASGAAVDASICATAVLGSQVSRSQESSSSGRRGLLPFTGSSHIWVMVQVAAILIALGAALQLWRRRRTAAATLV
jgi:hypothetical protein